MTNLNIIDKEKHCEMMEDKDLTGVFVYSNGCRLCSNQIKKLEKAGILVSGVIDCTSDSKYFLGLGFDDMPDTVVYIRGVKVYSSTGEMFDTQISELVKFLERY